MHRIHYILLFCLIATSGHAQNLPDTATLCEVEWKIVSQSSDGESVDKFRKPVNNSSFWFSKDGTFRYRVWDTMGELTGRWKVRYRTMHLNFDNLEELKGTVSKRGANQIYIGLEGEKGDHHLVLEQDNQLKKLPQYQPSDSLSRLVTKQKWVISRLVSKDGTVIEGADLKMGFKKFQLFPNGVFWVDSGHEVVHWKAWDEGKRLTFKVARGEPELEQFMCFYIESVNEKHLVIRQCAIYPFDDGRTKNFCAELHCEGGM